MVGTSLVVWVPEEKSLQSSKARIARRMPLSTKETFAPLIAEAVSDLEPLFECPLVSLAGNIRFLLSEREKNKIALCQQLAVAKMRLESGEAGSISWKVWCQRFVLNGLGTPYPQSACDKWAKIGAAKDVVAAFTEWRESERRHRVKNDPNVITDMKADEVKDRLRHINNVAGLRTVERLLGTPAPVVRLPTMAQKTNPKLMSAKIKTDYRQEIGRQVNLLMVAWEEAQPEARQQFLSQINAQYVK